jgi:D-ribose pyranose/furanose isomerase RbsD
MFDEDAAEVVIPDKIIVNDVTYRVTAIGAKAFYKNKSVKKVTVGKNITKIKSKAFYGCTKLKKITINSKKLKTESIGKSAFTKMKKNVKIYVPSTKYTAYKKLLKKAGVGSKAKIYKSK